MQYEIALAAVGGGGRVDVIQLIAVVKDYDRVITDAKAHIAGINIIPRFTQGHDLLTSRRIAIRKSSTSSGPVTSFACVFAMNSFYLHRVELLG